MVWREYHLHFICSVCVHVCVCEREKGERMFLPIYECVCVCVCVRVRVLQAIVKFDCVIENITNVVKSLCLPPNYNRVVPRHFSYREWGRLGEREKERKREGNFDFLHHMYKN